MKKATPGPNALVLSCLLVMLACLPAVSAAQTPEAQLIIRGGWLIDMVEDGQQARQVEAIVIRDGRIDTIIEPGSRATIPPAARNIDAADRFILPGFFDAHVHFRPFLPDASIWKRATIYHGITSIFDTGPCGTLCSRTGIDPNEWISEYRDFMNAPGVPDGPTLYMTGRRIQPLDGIHPLGMKFSTRAEIADYLDTLVELGVDGVKVESTLPPDLRAAVVEEAGARNLPVVGHSRDAFESIEAGMKFIEHMWPITSSIAMSDPGEKFNSPQHDHLMDLDQRYALSNALVENGVYVNPTMVGRYGYFADFLADAPADDFASFEFGGLYSDLPVSYQEEVRAWWARDADWDAETRANRREGLRKVGVFLKHFSDSGGRVLVATDAGEDKLAGISFHREMQMLADAGLSPYRILLGATRYPAELARKDDRVGTIEAGKDADIVIVSENPVSDIEHAADIAWVIKHGTVLRSPDDCSVIRPPVAKSCR